MMKTTNTIEREINATRVKIYERTKDMTPKQRVEYYQNKTADTIKKYGFKVIASAVKR